MGKIDWHKEVEKESKDYVIHSNKKYEKVQKGQHYNKLEDFKKSIFKNESK